MTEKEWIKLKAIHDEIEDTRKKIAILGKNNLVTVSLSVTEKPWSSCEIRQIEPDVKLYNDEVVCLVNFLQNKLGELVREFSEM